MGKSIHNSTILIVDDTPENIDILNDVLKDYKRKIATGGETALKIAQSGNPPDIILLDIMMPGMDGYEVCKRLKSNESTKNIPIIFITAMSEVEDETKGLELGAVDFITKPISPPVVLARVKNHLELKIFQEQLQTQNILLEDRNKYITDSINYAKRIQTAILPDEKAIRECFPNSFLIYHPKDIVSGDFYWISKVGEKCMIAVVDCTGHGVPGAFMSMIGNTLLNKIVIEKGVTDPAEVLNLLDQGVIDELHKEQSGASFDGMDIGLCMVDYNNKLMQYAGAYRTLFYFQNNELKQIKGDKKSIGEKKKELKFALNEITLTDDLVIYVTSDGFIDQHNIDGQKYGSKRLREKLSKIYSLDFRKQKEILEAELENHRGTQVQRDDITFLGIKIK